MSRVNKEVIFGIQLKQCWSLCDRGRIEQDAMLYGKGKKLNFGVSAASSELCRAQGWDSACPIATVLGLCTHTELRDTV